jgi:hypothetical protein
MKWLRTLPVALLLAILTAGCPNRLGTQPPTVYPTEYLSTVIALTVAAEEQAASQTTPEPTTAATGTEPAAAVLPSASPTPSMPDATQTLASIPPSALPTIANQTATPTRPSSQVPMFTAMPNIPNAAIQFASPGPLSRIISPLEVVATVHSVPSGSYRIELWAEPLLPGGEPRLLLRKVANFIADPIPWVFLTESLEFELSRVSELAELRILTYELVLLQIGENQINPNGDVLQPLVILEPAPNILIQGGTLIVTGMARPLDSQPLFIELIAASGDVVGYQQVFLTPDPAGSHLPFAVDVHYTVSSPTWVRLIISQSGARIPGVRLLNSLEVLLSP